MKYDLRKGTEQDIFLQNDDVVLMKNGTIFNVICCDCGLAHNIVIKKAGRSISYKAIRNNPKTVSFREKRVYLCQPVIKS